MAEFAVYEDFFNYESGIYEYVSGDFVGGHSVKVIGWGQLNGVNYWIAANSWGTAWGEAGFFRIQMGEVQFESRVWACSPNLNI